MVLMMLDATKGEVQRALLEKELESVGIRLNRKKPNIYFKVPQIILLSLKCILESNSIGIFFSSSKKEVGLLSTQFVH